MKKDLSDTKRYFIIGIMAIVLVIAFLLAVLPVTANAETTEITSNEEVYKELTDDDQLAGLDITLDDYINNMKSEYYNQTSGTGDTGCPAAFRKNDSCRNRKQRLTVRL